MKRKIELKIQNPDKRVNNKTWEDKKEKYRWRGKRKTPTKEGRREKKNWFEK